MVSCILLSAGLSQRFGSPKALAVLEKSPIVEMTQRTLLDSKVDEIIIVLGAHKKMIQPHILKHKKIRLVYNKDYILGQTTSFKTGLIHANNSCLGFMLLPIDYPVIQKETLDLLVKVFLEKKPMILIPRFKGRKGHPPIFHASLRKEILRIDNAVGINTLTHRYESQTHFVDLEDQGVVMSFNTPEEFFGIIENKTSRKQ